MALFHTRKARHSNAGMSGVTAVAPGRTPPDGTNTWIMAATPMGLARGQPTPEQGNQRRDPRLNPVNMFGGVIKAMPRRNDIGAAGYVPRFGVVLTNPIGAGIQARYRPLPYYGPAGQYVDHIIFWAQQTIPTSVRLSGLAG